MKDGDFKMLKGNNKVKKTVPLDLTVSLVVLSTAVTFLSTFLYFNISDKPVKTTPPKKSEIVVKMEEIDTYVKENFYGNPDYTALGDDMAEGYINGLNDPYTRYFTADEVEAVTTEVKTRFFNSIGILTSESEKDKMEVIHVNSDSPAYDAGIRKNDIITAVNRQEVNKIGYQQALKDINGDNGTPLLLTVKNKDSEKEFRLTRKLTKIPLVETYIFDNNIGYIKIKEFDEGTDKEFESALIGLKTNGIKKFVCDMRDNPGGKIAACQAMLDLLLPEYDLIETIDNKGNKEVYVQSVSGNEIDLTPVILVNEQSASCSEMFAVSMRDFTGVSVVGTVTFGKGIMQNYMTLPDGSQINVTTRAFKSTRSPSYHGIGISPDYEVFLEDGEKMFMTDGNQDIDTQLKKAIEVAEQLN